MDTHTLMSQLPGETILTLRTQARARTVELGLPAMMFDQAEAMVERDHVCLDGPRSGWVYDAGAWRNVSLKYCAHCGSGGACVHQLAIMFADLLSRHAPQPEEPVSATATGDGYIPTGIPGRAARCTGSGSGGSCRRAKGCTGNCGHCGFFRHGRCRNPSKRR